MKFLKARNKSKNVGMQVMKMKIICVNLASTMNVPADYASTERLKGASNCVGTTWATSRGSGPFGRANYTLAGTAMSFVLWSCESNGINGWYKA